VEAYGRLMKTVLVLIAAALMLANCGAADDNITGVIVLPAGPDLRPRSVELKNGRGVLDDDSGGLTVEVTQTLFGDLDGDGLDERVIVVRESDAPPLSFYRTSVLVVEKSDGNGWFVRAAQPPSTKGCGHVSNLRIVGQKLVLKRALCVMRSGGSPDAYAIQEFRFTGTEFEMVSESELVFP
jgi:hypothetical protein